MVGCVKKGGEIARIGIGIVTKRGPSAPVIDETIRETYNMMDPNFKTYSEVQMQNMEPP